MWKIPGTVQLFSSRKTGVEWFADLTMDPESLVDPRCSFTVGICSNQKARV
jgi:hypothetical protein